MASLHSNWRFGKRSKLRVKVSQDPEDCYRLDPMKSTAENSYDIYKMLCSRDTRDTKRLFLLNALASLCLTATGTGQNSLRFTTEELFYCLSASLVHTFTQVRAAALRTIRYALATPKDVKVFNSMQLQHLLCRSIDLMLKNDDERVQALKLVRKMLAISPEDISPVVVRCLVSLADSGIEESDNLLRACLATLCELAVLNPTLLIVCGGVTSITRNVLECYNPRIAESLCGVLLYLLEWPETRNICGVRLDCLAAPYCDFTYRLGIMDKNKDARELRYTSCRLALLSVLQSWTGTLEFCDPSKPSGLKAIVDALYLNQIEVRKAILDLLYELLGLPQPAWTDNYAVALQAVDPSDIQDSWLLSNGFVAAEGRSILPSLAARAPNIVGQHLALLLYCFLETGLLNALVEVIVSSDQQVSIRATVLIGKIMHLMHTHLPADICSMSPALPTLISHASQGNQQATAAISALQSYQKMLRQRPASCSLFLDSIIQGGALIHTRLFRRDINAQEYAIAVNAQTSNVLSPIPQSSVTLDRPRLDSVSSSDESMSQSSSSIRSSFRLKRRFLPFFDNMRSLNRLIKDSNVLSLADCNAWDWEVITTILRSNLLRKIDDPTSKFLKKLVEFYKPSSNRFSHQDLVLGPPMPAYVAAGLDLIDVLLILSSNDLEYMRLITDLFYDISQHLLQVTTLNRAHDCLFSPQHMNNTMCQQYFLYIGRMCRGRKGISVLNNTNIFAHLKTLVSNTDHICYVKLIVSGLDYSAEVKPRKVLEKALTGAKTRAGRLYATQFLAVLLRARLPNFEVWGIPMIILQTKDRDRSVVLAAMDVLEEACHDKDYLEEIVSLWPNLKMLGDVGRLLMSRYYSLSRGLNNCKAKIKEEIEYWKNGYNKRYVLLVEADTHSSLTLHVRNEDGYYSRRNCNTRPITVPPNIVPHLYGQMVQTAQGMTSLRNYGDLVPLVEIVSRAKCTDEAECVELKSAIWAVAHASTHSNGIEYFIETGSRIYEKLILLATKCEVYSIRATAFSALGLVAGTNAGANILFKLNWLSVRHDRNTTWPVHQPEDWMSSNYTPVRHHYEDMPPYNYTGIEDQIDGSYYTGSYWNLLLSSSSTTKGGGGAASASSEAQDANTTTDSVRTVADEIQSNKAFAVNASATTKSKTLPEGTYMRQGKHQRSMSESKTMDLMTLISGMPATASNYNTHCQHRIRYNSCTDSNTSGVSSCESVTGRTAAAAVGDFQQFPLSPIPSMSNLLELPIQSTLMRRTSLLGTTYLQQALSPLDIKGYAQLRSLRANSRPVFPESTEAELYHLVNVALTEFRPRKSSFVDSQRRKVRSLDRHLTSLKGFARLSSEELQVPLPTLNTPKFLSQTDSKGPCYAGICLPKNPLDLFPTRNLSRTYVSRDIQDQDLMDNNLLTAKQQFLNDSLNNEGGDESSVISSLSDVSSVSKRTKWHQAGKHGRNQCINCSRLRRNQQTHTLRIDGDATNTISNGVLTISSASSASAPSELYSFANGALLPGSVAANTAMTRKGVKQSAPSKLRQQQQQQNTQSSSTIQLLDISFNSPESIISEESLPDRITASILYNVQRLANPVSAKQSKMALLELKQKHPNTFQDICLYSEACKTLGRSSYRMSARRFLQELFLDLNFDSFYAEPQEILSKKSKIVYATPTGVAENRTEVEVVLSQNLEVAMMVEPSMHSSSGGTTATLTIPSAVHKSQLKLKPLASVYETSCENLLVDQSPRLSNVSTNRREQKNELHIATDEDDDKGGGAEDDDVGESNLNNTNDQYANKNINDNNMDVGEDVCDNVTHNVSVNFVPQPSGCAGTSSVIIASGGGGSSNCSDQTTNSNRSSICTISHQPATMTTTTTTPTICLLENENKKYTRGRFYTLELDLSCTINKFPITDRTRTTTTSGATAASTSLSASRVPVRLVSFSNIPNFLTEANDLNPHQTNTQTRIDGDDSVKSTEPQTTKCQSSASEYICTPVTLNSLRVTKSLAASMVAPVGSLFCEKRLQTSKSEAVLVNVTNVSTTTATNIMPSGVVKVTPVSIAMDTVSTKPLVVTSATDMPGSATAHAKHKA